MYRNGTQCSSICLNVGEPPLSASSIENERQVGRRTWREGRERDPSWCICCASRYSNPPGCGGTHALGSPDTRPSAKYMSFSFPVSAVSLQHQTEHRPLPLNPPNSITNWGPSIQTLEPMKDISHSNQHKRRNQNNQASLTVLLHSQSSKKGSAKGSCKIPAELRPPTA